MILRNICGVTPLCKPAVEKVSSSQQHETQLTLVENGCSICTSKQQWAYVEHVFLFTTHTLSKRYTVRVVVGESTCKFHWCWESFLSRYCPQAVFHTHYSTSESREYTELEENSKIGQSNAALNLSARATHCCCSVIWYRLLLLYISSQNNILQHARCLYRWLVSQHTTKTARKKTLL